MKIAIVGPESTGKTQLCKKLALYYQGQWIPEFARYHLLTRHNQYQANDLPHMAAGQLFWRDLYSRTFPTDFLFFDTTLITYHIWSLWKYHHTHPYIEHHFNHEHFDLILLTYPDLPWEHDPQRENPHDRHQLFEVHRQILTRRNANFQIIKGLGHHRLLNAINIIKREKKNLHM